MFRIICDIICDECEIDEVTLLSSSRTAEVVDARWVLVQCLHEQGLYPCDIARYSGLSVRSVNHILCNFDDRLKYGFYIRNNYANIQQEIGKMFLLGQ